MAKWRSPIYNLKTSSGKDVKVDVTTSVSLGLPPKGTVLKELIPFFRTKNVNTVIDFGAGALRHVFPLLEAGFQVCAVEFNEQFRDGICRERLEKANRHANFSKLIWPHDFIHDDRKFDAGILSFVLQTMPEADERDLVLKLLRKKLKAEAYLFYVSRYGQLTAAMKKRRVKDGYYMWPDRAVHSFYTEFNTEDTHKWMKKYKFDHIKSFSERGTDQIFLYAKGKATWI